MITNADIEKLKGTFATKDDLKGFATKDDLKKFATKENLKEAVADLRVEIGEVNDKVDTLSEKFDSFDVKLDKIIGGLEDERIENAAGATILYRHSRQIEALAHATNTTLPE